MAKRVLHKKVRLLSFGDGDKEHVFVADENNYVERHANAVCGRNKDGAVVAYRHDTTGMCKYCKMWLAAWKVDSVEENLLMLSKEIGF